MQGTEHGIRPWWLLLLPVLTLYALALVLPLIVVVGESFSTTSAATALARSSLTFDNYRAFASDGVTLRVFFATVRLAALITMTCVVLGYPLALFMRRAGSRLRIVILALVVSPLLTSVIVRNVGWLLILGREGLINKLYWASWHRSLGKLAMDLLGPRVGALAPEPMLLRAGRGHRHRLRRAGGEAAGAPTS